MCRPDLRQSCWRLSCCCLRAAQCGWVRRSAAPMPDPTNQQMPCEAAALACRGRLAAHPNCVQRQLDARLRPWQPPKALPCPLFGAQQRAVAAPWLGRGSSPASVLRSVAASLPAATYCLQDLLLQACLRPIPARFASQLMLYCALLRLVVLPLACKQAGAGTLISSTVRPRRYGRRRHRQPARHRSARLGGRDKEEKS